MPSINLWLIICGAMIAIVAATVLQPTNLWLILFGVVIAIGATIVFILSLIRRQPKSGKFRRWQRGLWEAISMMLGA